MRYLRSTIASAAIMLAGTGAAFAQGTGNAGAVKLSKADCQSIWSKADSAQNDSLTSAQAAPFVTNFKAVDSNGDGKLSSAEFMSGCQRGLAHDTASAGAGAGTSGESGDGAPAKRY
jgi:hypothetical protein